MKTWPSDPSITTGFVSLKPRQTCDVIWIWASTPAKAIYDHRIPPPPAEFIGPENKRAAKADIIKKQGFVNKTTSCHRDAKGSEQRACVSQR